MPNEADKLFNSDEAAKYLDIDRRTLEGWRYRRNVGPKFLRYSNRVVRYRKSDLDAFLERSVVEPEAVNE